ncbi:MAG: hypothetical protein AB203_04405 [Parcubacteria bacterium C7867-008]|nr:MAG: hypothetical protein AB203_04405 [Parcubacteria bacterium C7867-008]
MKIVLATPLYPPDVAVSATYAKELFVRLAGAHPEHTFTIVTYTALPETIQRVRIVSVNKELPLPLRLLACTATLLKETRGADLLIIHNGASMELPGGIASLFSRIRVAFQITDTSAHEHAQRSKVFGMIERFVSKRAQQIRIQLPTQRPEILPLQASPETELSAYEESWKRHVLDLDSIIFHG